MNIAETRSVGALILWLSLNLGARLHKARMLLSGGAATSTLVVSCLFANPPLKILDRLTHRSSPD